MALLSADSFNRANGAAGSTDGAGSLDPKTWTTQSGTWAIDTNQLSTTGTVPAILTCDLATADVDITYTHVVSDVNGQGIICRFSDTSNYVFLNGDTTQLRLQKLVAGSTTNISSLIGPPFLGTNTVVRLVASGNQFWVYHDGALDPASPYTDSFNSTATKHGLRHGGTSQRSDAWSVSSPGSGTTTMTGTRAFETDTARRGSLPFPSNGQRVVCVKTETRQEWFAFGPAS